MERHEIHRKLEQKLGYDFTDSGLLEEALTHASFCNEQSGSRPKDNERLEFLGDAVLQLIVTHHLFLQHPSAPEGELTRSRADLVSEGALAIMARRLHLGEALQLGKGENQSGGREKDSILADAMEALFGAIYLDGGYEPVKQLILPLLAVIPRRTEVRHVGSDHKTRLQEISQAQYGRLPLYQPCGFVGPDHRRTYTVEVRLNGEVMGRGQGRSKKMAEQNAAKEALQALGELP